MKTFSFSARVGRLTNLLLIMLVAVNISSAQNSKKTYKLLKTIYGKLSPKSISNNGKNVYFAQNMMYNHTVTVYDSSFNLVSTISDNINSTDYGLNEKDESLNGSPVESVATKDGKYLWVSNYFMSGGSYSNPGCDTCCCKGYDGSLVYKINTQNYKIESVVKVGSVPKYLTISPDQKKLIVSNWSSGDVSIIDLETEKEVKRVYVGPAPRGIACDTSSSFAYIAVMGCNKISKIDLNTYTAETFISGVRNPRHLCITKNYLYASLNGEQSICRIDLFSGDMKKLVVGRAPRSMVVSAGGDRLFVDCYGDDKVSVINLSNFKMETEFKTNKSPIGICLSTDSKEVWVSCYSGSIQVFADTTEREKPQIAIGKPKQEQKINFDSIAAEKWSLGNSLKEYVTEKKVEPVAKQKLEPLAEHKPEPVHEQKPAPIHETVSAKNETGSYIVLGSFMVKENAQNLKSKLVKKGINIELIPSKTGYTYCACKAKTIDKEESEKQIAELEALTGIKGWLYTNI